jgi:hypothetical protein
MATTTNYGWTTPDDTALVKDGAAAIRTLGSSVDTTTKALNPSTTLGDIEYRSSTANTNTRLGIGSTGDVLTVAGGVPSWAAPAGGGSGLTLVQRSTFSNVAGTSTTFDGVFTSTYVNYLISFENLRAANVGDDLQFLFRASAVDSTNHYGNCMSNAYNASTWSSTSSNNVAQLTMYTANANADYPMMGEVYVNNIGTTTRPSTTGHLFSGYDNTYSLFYGGTDNAGTYTGFRLKSASGNITGTVAVYGLAKS